MKSLPIDVSTFSTIILGNYHYVDKTKLIYELFKGGGRYYFLSRPRRFGKSLLISLLKELFEGNRQFFTDLWINQADYEWKYHPVIHLDFGNIKHTTPEELIVNLSWKLELIAQGYSIDVSSAPSAEAKIELLITELSKQYGPNSVVILIDEYDKPLIDHLQSVELARNQRQALRSFYDVLKGMDPYLRALFITGVSRFSKTSIFSGLNNLNDISMDYEAAQLLGYTEQEIIENFSNYIEKIAKKRRLKNDDVLRKMREWYNGYAFSEELVKVYNPFSILYYLQKQKLMNYWYESGTPFFLINLLKKEFEFLEDLEDAEFSRYSLGTFDIEDIPLVTLLYQAGYLTIKDYNEKNDKFILGYPNIEVEESLNKYLVSALTGTHMPAVEKSVSVLVRALERNNIDSFCKTLQSLFAHIPYTLYIEQEAYFHSLFHFLSMLIGIEIDSEIMTNQGRVDLVIEAKSTIFVFELKLNSDPIKAIQQIHQKRYYERYLIKQKPITLVGISFITKNNKLTIACATESLDNRILAL